MMKEHEQSGQLTTKKVTKLQLATNIFEKLTHGTKRNKSKNSSSNQNLKKSIDTGINHIIKYLTNSLINGKRIEIRGFGSFALRRRDSRCARNPKTGAILQTKPTFTIHFKPAKPLKKKINCTKFF